MRTCLPWTCVLWTCLLWTSGTSTPEDRTELRAGGVSPPRLDVPQPGPVRGAGARVGAGGRRRAALSGPHVCGYQCCVGWTVSPKTRTCIKSRCSPPCHNGAFCRRPNRCVCRRGFYGSRCELATVTLSLPGRPPTSIRPTILPRPPPRPSPAPQSHVSQPVSTMAVLTTEGHAHAQNPRPDSGVSARFPGEEQNRAALRSEEVKMEAAAGETTAPSQPEFNDLRLWVRDDEGAEVTGRPANKSSGLDTEVQEDVSGPQTLSVSEGEDMKSESSDDPGSIRPRTGGGEPEESEGGDRANVQTESEERGGISGSKGQTPMASNVLDLQSELGLRTEERGEEREVRRRKEEVKTAGPKNQPLSVREAQAVLLRKTLSRGGRGDKMAALLMKHIERERKRLHAMTSSSSSSSSVKTSMKSFHSQRGQYTVHVSAPAVDGQMATAGAGGGGDVERIQVMFTPTICKVRCHQDRCVNYCERGNVTTLYSSGAEGGRGAAGGGAAGEGRSDGSHGPGFRVFLCPLLCKNGGVCLQKDRCLCPPAFTGKFCQIPVASGSASSSAAAASPSSTNEIVKPALVSASTANQELTQSEFLVPLGQEAGRTGGSAPSMVKVRVQHPPEASVKIHQVLKVSGFGPTLRTLSSASSGSAGAPAPPGVGVQAQTVRGDGSYTEHAGFKYCFREVKDGQCSSPLPGLRSRDMCCRGIGRGWGITDCVLCPGKTGGSNSSCPSGFEHANGTQCVDVNECLQPGLCENGLCVNTRGSYSCVCRVGFILDATHGICISQSVISEERGQCFRVLGPGQGPSSCSLPILRNITKQICCCSRVGKAWGPACLRCPHFGSVAFKEICPAGPGYHYSASALQFSQRASEQLGARGAPLVPHRHQDQQAADPGARPPSSGGPAGTAQTRLATGSPSTRTAQSSSTGASAPPDKPRTPGRTGTQQVRPDPAPPQRPPPPSTGSHVRPSAAAQPDQAPPRGDALPAPARPGSHQEPPPPPEGRLAVAATTRPSRVQPVRSVCESRPDVCGRGLCVDQPGGKHSCVCDQGHQPNGQHTHCQDVNECVQSPAVCSVGECVNTMGSYRCVCPPGFQSDGEQTRCEDVDECQLSPCRSGRCDNTAGSYRCVCGLGYRLTGHTCTDVDECADPLQCPGQECINSPGSYRCASCQPGYTLTNQLCTDIDECRQAPCSSGRCENTPGSYRCICRHGYRLQNNTCTDVDECAEPSQCPGQVCVNTVGSYHCVSCGPGYTLTNRQCADVDECEDSASCPGQQCVNTHGSYSCVSCQQGYSSVRGVCADVDECASAGACDAERVCVNTLGSFRCECRPGYRSSGLGRQCRDVNECLEGDFCFSRGECVNTPGSYTCVCSQGFTLSANGTSCLDVDECERAGVCVDGRCVNSEGSFHCQCDAGFTANHEGTACLDVDECGASGGVVCGLQRCENTIGSYRCLTSCEPGYQVYQGRCVDVNECANQTVCGDHAFCQNLIGTYLCVCDRGFTATADGKSCVDEDECVSLAGVCGSARCENVEGSFMCECDHGEFDTTTRKCVSAVPPAEAVPSSSSSSSSSPSPSSFHVSRAELDPVLPPLPAARPGELRECYYNLAERGTCSLLAANSSRQECCCTVGQGWGLGCQYHPCPPADTADFLSLCPSGRGYVTTGPGAFSYRDVDECKRFHPEVCKSGVCVNNIPGYNCYCSSGYVYNSTLLECVDHDECEEESCVGGVCVNTVGSYYCSCPPPLVLDDTQRNCVNSSHLTVDENMSVCWQHVSADLMCQSPLLGGQVTFTDCCCLYGEGWGMECALCPSTDSDDYAFLCSSFSPPLFPSFPDSGGSELGARRGAPPHFPPYAPDSFAPPPSRDFSRPDYDDYSPAGGSRSGFRTPSSFSVPDAAYRRPEYGTGFYSEGDYSSPDGPPPRPPSFRLPPDPRAETAFGVRPPPPSRRDGPPLSLAPLPGAPYDDQEEAEEETWRSGPPFPPFTDRRGGAGGGAGAPRRVYERRYESYAGLSAAEDCGILHGCENGRCIRVAEGYTCDCYQGYELDMTSMTCIDVNECEDGAGVEFPCVNARCVNTDGSFRCVCRRGYVMSRRPNHCVAA